MQILETLFSFLDLNALKTCRLVCRQWSYEAGRVFPNVLITILKSRSQGELETIFQFLSHHKINHALCLSIFEEEWVESADEYFQKVNDLEFLQVLTNAYRIFPRIGNLIVELRLKVMLRNASDAEAMGKILKLMPHDLTRLSLELVEYSDEGVLAISRDWWPPIIKTLGVFVQRGPHGSYVGLISLSRLYPFPSPILCLIIQYVLCFQDPEGYHGPPRISLQQSSYDHLFQLCPSLEYLDFDAWSYTWYMGDRSRVTKCLEAISSDSNPNKSCPNLKGVAAESIVSNEQCLALASFPRPLEFITAHIVQSDSSTVDNVKEMLSRQAHSLKIFELFWHPGIGFDGAEVGITCQKIHLSKNMVELETLSLIQFLIVSPEEIEGFNLDMVDTFGLRTMFLVNCHYFIH